MVSIILACTMNGGIGFKGTLPWNNIKEDINLFKNITINNTIVMGRKTWESIPNKPLKNRKNIVISSKKIPYSDVETMHSIEETIQKYPNAIYIGGATIYNYLIKNNLVKEAHISFIHSKKIYTCDTFIDIEILRKKNHIIEKHIEFNDFTYLHVKFTSNDEYC